MCVCRWIHRLSNRYASSQSKYRLDFWCFLCRWPRVEELIMLSCGCLRVQRLISYACHFVSVLYNFSSTYRYFVFKLPAFFVTLCEVRLTKLSIQGTLKLNNSGPWSPTRYTTGWTATIYKYHLSKLTLYYILVIHDFHHRQDASFDVVLTAECQLLVFLHSILLIQSRITYFEVLLS